MPPRPDAAPVDLDPSAVLTHRLAAHGLTSRAAEPAGLAVLALGVQDSPPGALRAALSARLGEPLSPDDDLTAGGTLTLVWSHRGAPHLHRTAELAQLAAASWPRDDADALARLGWQRKRLTEAGVSGDAAYREVAEAVADVLARGTVTKSELSTAVTGRITPTLSPWCGPCDTHHVAEQLLRLAALPGGARLRPGSRPLTFEAIPDWPGIPDAPAPNGPLQAAVRALFAGASAADVAGFLGTAVGFVTAGQPAGLVPVRVGGRAGLATPSQVEQVRAGGPAPSQPRLLPPSDPWLQARDRELIVPDERARTQVWRPLGSPGVVLSGVEAVGVWRTRQRGRGLQVTVEGFRTLRRAERTGLDAEAERLRTVRGATTVTVEVAA